MSTPRRSWKQHIAGKTQVIILLVLLLPFYLTVSSAATSKLIVTRYVPIEDKTTPFQWCTGIFFFEDLECVVSSKNSWLLFRRPGEKKFVVSPLHLNQPHAVAYSFRNKLFYLVDTDNHRLISTTSIQKESFLSTTSSIAGVTLKRPHDVLVDQQTGWVYVLNPAPVTVLRFKNIGVREEALDLSKILKYSRALTINNGKVYVVGSALGKIVVIDDFSGAKVTTHQSAGKKKHTYAGNWQETGLIPNDLEYYDGYWYLTSYFYPGTCATGPCDYNRNKLIRFSSWQDFEQGTWEDLSNLLPNGQVPYFLTRHDGALFIALFDHSFPEKGGGIYRLQAK